MRGMRGMRVMRARPGSKRAARGLGLIAVLVVLVALAALAAAIARIGAASQLGQAQDLEGARAWQAARAGTDWGLYQALKGSWSACSSQSRTLDLSGESGLNGLRVTVSCDSRSFNEGETAPGTPHSLRVYTIDAVACNSSTACPDNTRALQPGYVERKRRVQAAQ